jgi:histidinol-phosphatase (PHP family)
MKFVDYHVHSSFSCDGESTIFEMCEKAVEVGLVEIGFSDHMDFDPKDWGYKFFDYNSYSSEIA